MPTFDLATTMYPRLSCSASNSGVGTFSIIQTPILHSSNNPTVGVSQTLGGAAFGCGGEGVVFSYEWAATPLPADGTALVKLGQTLPCLSLWSFEPRGNISDGAVSEEVLRAWALVGCSRCCSYGCCCPSLLLVPCRGDQEVGGLCWRSLLLLLLEPLTGAPGPVPYSSVCHSHPPTLAISLPHWLPLTVGRSSITKQSL